MTNKEAIEKIRSLFGFSKDTTEAPDTTNEVEKEVKVELSVEETQEQTNTYASAQVVDSDTIIGVEGEWEVGKNAFIITEEENIQAPEGQYILDNGFTIVVDENGMITDIMETEGNEVEVEESTATPTTEEMSEDIDFTELVSVIESIKEVIETRFNQVEKTLQEKDEVIKDLQTKVDTFGKQPGSKKITNSYFENIKRDNNDQDFKFNKVRELAKKLNK